MAPDQLFDPGPPITDASITDPSIIHRVGSGSGPVTAQVGYST
jgi:hypothetical protein